MNDNKTSPIDHETLSNEDYEPVYATLHFYYNDEDSMRRMKGCLDAPKVLLAVKEFEQWLHMVMDCNDGEYQDALEAARDKLFACFADNDATVPGWE